MTNKKIKIIQWTALLSCGFIATQIATILFKGEAFCLNQGCKIVENLSIVPPIYINLAGFLFFLAVFATSRCSQDRPQPFFDWLRPLLLTGLAIEGVLISYQLFVAQTVCYYCLVIFGLIVLLNIIYGRKQLLLGGPVLLAVFITFSSLNFGSSQILLQAQNLESGTFAVKGQVAPSSQQYLFFSSDCPHCRNVLDLIESDNNCEFNFNPIDRIESLEMSGLNYSTAYNPSLNRLLLSLLDIKTIPVLLTRNQDSLTLIKGEGAIVDFINESCFEAPIDPYSGSSSNNDTIGISSNTAPEGECEIEVECPEPVEESTSSAY
ncbi:MAG: hypothetical protein KAS94_09680 [Desulfobulbaceae bacterium]|nr:hypothetical protein [Desulfobulbaceae bacterium]